MLKIPTIPGITNYVVLSLASRKVLYKGQSGATTAEHSERGTCFGYGVTEEDALRMAVAIANRCREHERRKQANVA